MSCKVPGCTNETYMGWAPIGEQNGKQICRGGRRRWRDSNFGLEESRSMKKYIILFLLFTATASAAIFINSFNSGQLSKDLKVRHDLDKATMGSETLQNILVRPQGMAYKRPGTEFIDTAPTVVYQAGVPEVLSDYPVLRAVAEQTDPGLTHTTAINNVTELQAMNTNLAGNYYLTGDIDASATSGWNGGQGFIPVGGLGPGPFTGTFDGCGYTITGLVCNRPSTSYQGLFGYVTNPAIIANVTLPSCTIIGRTFCGALVGYLREYTGTDVKVQNCHSSGTVQGTTNPVTMFLGGLIGGAASNSTGAVYIYDCSSSCTVTTPAVVVSEALGGLIGFLDVVTISNCFSTGNVVGGTVGLGIGGFVGEIGTTTAGSVITYCYATGAVSGNTKVGGFIGISSQNDVIQKCSATGNVTIASTGATDGGGFVGRNSNADYTDCYAWGDVTCAVANGRVGGFAGADLTIGSDSLFTNCYSIGSATGLLNPGGFIELTSGTPVISDSYWDTEASGNAISDGGVGKTTIWLKTKTNYPASWNFTTIWYMADYVPAVSEVWIAGAGSDPIRLIPWEHDVNDADVLELGHRYIGFLRTVP